MRYKIYSDQTEANKAKTVNAESKSFIEKGVILETRVRFLKTFIDFIILARIDKINCTKITHIILYFKIQYNIRINPGRIYPLFVMLEQKGLIKRLPNRSVRLYILTLKGKMTLEAFEKNLNPFQKTIEELVKGK